ncbi:MAG: hypothetical protein KKD39_06610, partial [Candidatus Altiarchaeota archaeon]|nr:hypothetical protein [Candidatus Altiarchaeota archaeon]
ERVITDPLVMSRLTGTGILTKKDAEETHAVGPTARGSGINNDVRQSMAEYKDFDFRYIVLGDMDNKDRILVRGAELFESLEIIRQIADRLPAGPSYETPKLKFDTDYVQAYNEAPRGELYHALKIDAQGNARNYRIRTPTPPNLAAMERACIGDQITDALLTIVSCDPCLSCSNRAIIVDSKTGKERLYEIKGGKVC